MKLLLKEHLKQNIIVITTEEYLKVTRTKVLILPDMLIIRKVFCILYSISNIPIHMYKQE